MPRTFDPLVAAVGCSGDREETGVLLTGLSEHLSKLTTREIGFLRGMRDKLLTEPSWKPSPKQMEWLRFMMEKCEFK